MKALLFLLCSIVLTGCAMAPKGALPFTEEALGKPDGESAIVVVYRDLVPPYAYDVRVHVEDARVGQLPNKAFTWVRVEPGSRRVNLKWPFLAATSSASIEVEAESGATYFINVSGGIDSFFMTSFGGVGTLSSKARLASYEEAVAHLRECCRYVPADIQQQ